MANRYEVTHAACSECPRAWFESRRKRDAISYARKSSRAQSVVLEVWLHPADSRDSFLIGQANDGTWSKV